MVLALCGAFAPAQAEDWPQWRGPNRDGISQEKGLLQAWPKDGPKLLWKRTDIGSGYSTPAVVGDHLFLLANEGLEEEVVEALAVQDGKRVWSTRLGPVGNPKQQPEFPAARSTPTVHGDLVYALSSDGDLACLEKPTGKKRWQKSLRTEFGGKPGTWAYAESPLLDGGALICTPGGSEATLLGLNKTQVIERAVCELAFREGFKDSRLNLFLSWARSDAVFAKEVLRLLQEAKFTVSHDDDPKSYKKGL